MGAFVLVLVVAVAALAGECVVGHNRYRVPNLSLGLPYGGYGSPGGNSVAAASAAAGGSASASASASGHQQVAHHEPHHVQHYMEPYYVHSQHHSEPEYVHPHPHPHPQHHHEPHYVHQLHNKEHHQQHHQPNTCAVPPCYGGIIQQTMVVSQDDHKRRSRWFRRRKPKHQRQSMEVSLDGAKITNN